MEPGGLRVINGRNEKAGEYLAPAGERVYTYVAGGGKDFAKARTKVEVVDEAGGTKEEDRAVGLGRGRRSGTSQGVGKGATLAVSGLKPLRAGVPCALPPHALKFRRNAARRTALSTTHVRFHVCVTTFSDKLARLRLSSRERERERERVTICLDDPRIDALERGVFASD